MRSAAKLLMSVGLLILIYCLCVILRGQLYQVYEAWIFDHTFRIGNTTIERGSIIVRPRTVPRIDGPIKRPEPPLYSLIGRIEIPRLKLSTMILEGEDEREFRLGAGHVPGTALPGEPGNVVIAAHRDTYFRPLKGISRNDEIRLTTRAGSYRYVVESVEVTDENNVSVLRASAGPTATLITCYPFSFIGSAPKRFIVHAREIAPQ